MPRLSTIIFIAACLTAVAAAAGTVWWQSIPEVNVGTPVRGPAVQAVYATGNVEPVHWAKVTPLERGRIVELCKCEGQLIRKGAFLARLDTGEIEAQVRELVAREQFTTDEVARYRSLWEKRTISRQAYERVVSNHDQARAAVAAARERIEHLLLRAPMDGTILRRDGEVGEVVESGQVLFWVGRPVPLWIIAEVDEEDIPLVAVDQKTLVKADAFPGQVLQGSVAQITPKGDPVNKSYRVRIHLPEDSPLRIGMTTEVNIVVAEKVDTLLVPATSVRGDSLFVIEGERVAVRDVVIGIRGNEFLEVLSGLDGVERLVRDGSIDLKDGARIRISGEDSPWAWLSTLR